MADTNTLPDTKTGPITTDSIVLPFETGPIKEIMKSVSTQSVDIDTTNSMIQVVLPSNEIELGVIAPDRKSIEKVVGRMIGGEGFLYELYKTEGFEGHFDLKITSLIGPLQALPFAKKMQSISHRINFYLEGNLVPAL
jgi:hypothetical protein